VATYTGLHFFVDTVYNIYIYSAWLNRTASPKTNREQKVMPGKSVAPAVKMALSVINTTPETVSCAHIHRLKRTLVKSLCRTEKLFS